MIDPQTNSPEQVRSSPTIWIDADACPNQIKELIFTTSRKRQIPVVLVANQTIRAPDSRIITVLTVPDGADKADDYIVDQIQTNDLVPLQLRRRKF